VGLGAGDFRAAALDDRSLGVAGVAAVATEPVIVSAVGVATFDVAAQAEDAAERGHRK
jgi:hypothetical protein